MSYTFYSPQNHCTKHNDSICIESSKRNSYLWFIAKQWTLEKGQRNGNVDSVISELHVAISKGPLWLRSYPIPVRRNWLTISMSWSACPARDRATQCQGGRHRVARQQLISTFIHTRTNTTITTTSSCIHDYNTSNKTLVLH